jgi:uncharacterized RDD family membrane protein YckC
MASFLYEGVLLFGLVMVTGLVYGVITRQEHALVGTAGLQAVVFVVLGIYFVGFWSRTGQTLAMQTWHVRLLARDGAPVSAGRALCRFLLSWLWFLPALFLLKWLGVKGSWPTFAALLGGVLVYAALARLHPQRQFLHDAACGTQLVSWQPGSHK